MRFSRIIVLLTILFCLYARVAVADECEPHSDPGPAPIITQAIGTALPSTVDLQYFGDNEITICADSGGCAMGLRVKDVDIYDNCETTWEVDDTIYVTAITSNGQTLPVNLSYRFSPDGVFYFNQFDTPAEPGDYTVRWTLEDFEAGIDTVPYVEWTVHVMPSDAPTCEDSDCDDNSGGGCSSCSGGGDGAPTPNPRTCSVNASTSPGGPAGATNSPNANCKAGKYEVVGRCERVFVKCWDCIGKGSVAGPFFKNSSGSFTAGQNNYKIEVSETLAVTITDSSGKKTTTDAYVDDQDGSGYVTQSVDGAANATTIDRNEIGMVDSVYLPGDATNSPSWTYQHTGTRYTMATGPDGTYTVYNYVGSGPALGKLSSKVFYDADSVEQSRIDYSYQYWDTSQTPACWANDSQGRLRSATKGHKTTTYDYTENGQVITVREVQRVLSGGGDLVSETSPFSETEYDYRDTNPDNDPSTLSTKVTRKHLLGPGQDQVTYYSYYADNGKKTYLNSIIDAAGKKTTYYVDVDTGITGYVEDASGEYTFYNYNYTTKALLSQEKSNQYGSGSYESWTYYNDTDDANGNPTTWEMMHRDARGNLTFTERALTSLWRVDAVKVAPYPQNPPSDQAAWRSFWATQPAIKQYEYYSGPNQDGLPGQLWRETVPNIEGTNPMITEYKYKQGDKYMDSPVQTIYYGTDGLAKTSTTIYDDAGRTLKTSDANGNSTWYTYDASGRGVMTISKWLGTAPLDTALPLPADLTGTGYTPSVYTQNVYSCCTLDAARDENGNWTYYEYDALNRVTGTWTGVQGDAESDNRLVTYTYDCFGNQHAVTTYSDEGVDRTTTYTYDEMNRVIKIEYPDDILGDEEFVYDELGRLALKKDGNSDVTAYSYDGLSRITSLDYDYSGSFGLPLVDPVSDVSYAYEGGTNLRTSMVQTSPSLTSSYTYDSQGRLKTYTPPVGLNSGYYVEYNYNNAGQKTEVKITDGSSTPYDVTYDYYANGWLKDVKSGTSTIASYGYDAIGNRLTQTNGNSTSTAYAYDTTDPRYPLNSITHASGSTTLATIGYPTRDNIGDPLSMTDWTGTWNYTYDANNRLDSATPPNPVPDQPAGGDYGYDWVGNRLNPPTGDNAMVYNAADQLTLWPGMHGNATTAGYVYDLAGNLTTVKDTAGNILSSYTYTPDGLMASATYKKYNWTSFVDTTLTNAWDADKNRVSFTAGGTTHTFVYDTTAGIPAVIKEDGIYYIREPGGELIARVSGSNISYYHFDQLGSTRLLTNGSGSVTDEYAYDAYGSLIAHQRFVYGDQPYKYVGQLGYYTHWQEPEFGLLQLGIRFCDTQMGRFTQIDPYGTSDISSYVYVNDSCTVATDPTGGVIEWRWNSVGGVPHTFICVNGACYGLYPVSSARAMANCSCSAIARIIRGSCCDAGVVKNDNKTAVGSMLVDKKNPGKSVEARVLAWILNQQKHPSDWCLIPGLYSDNCWTWAAKAWSVK